MYSVNLNNNSNKNYCPSTSFGTGPRAYLSNLHYNLTHKDSYEEYYAKKRQNNILGWVAVIGSSALLTAAVFLGLVTGKSQNISRKIQKFTATALSKLDKGKNKHLHKFLTVVANGFDKFSQTITNTSPIKDYALYKVMDKTKVTRKLRDGISKIFTKENISSVTKSREKAKESYSGVISAVEEAIADSEKNPSIVKDKAKLQKLKGLVSNSKDVPEFLTDQFFKDNYSIMEKDMEYLSQEVTMKRLLSKEAFQGFVPEAILMDRRTSYSKSLFESKNKISCSFTDKSQFARDRLNTANVLIYSVKDIDKQRALRNCSVELESSLKHFVKDSPNKENRSKNLASVQRNIDKFKETINTLPSGSNKGKLIAHLDEYNDLFAEPKLATIQEIRILAGDVWGNQSKHDIAIKKAAHKHNKDLNLSLKRMINMFDKQRDITLGSGPNDVLGLLAPIALFGIALSKDKTNDERVGTSLELGIPIVGGTLVYMKTLALQFNGFRALATSLGTGVLLNALGSEVFKAYKKGVEARKQSKMPEAPTPPPAVKDAALQRKLQHNKKYQLQNVTLNQG
jgi:hypothetical protein